MAQSDSVRAPRRDRPWRAGAGHRSGRCFFILQDLRHAQRARLRRSRRRDRCRQTSGWRDPTQVMGIGTRKRHVAPPTGSSPPSYVPQRAERRPRKAASPFTSIASNTGARLPGEELITCRTSAVAVCCSKCLPRLGQEPCILHCDDCLRSKTLQHCDLLIRERPDLLAVGGQNAENSHYLSQVAQKCRCGRRRVRPWPREKVHGPCKPARQRDRRCERTALRRRCDPDQ